MTNLSIIILSFNTKDLVLKCVHSIVSHYKKQIDEKEFEIIVVDNASTDGTVKAIKRSFDFAQDKISIIENSENFGFSKGNNIGAKAAQGKYIVFINSDTESLDNGLDRMIRFFDSHQEVGIVGGALKNYDESYQGSAGRFYHLFEVILVLLGLERLGILRPYYDSPTSVDWVSGAFLMARRDIFLKLGGFDEHFFMYLEDMELCFRAKKAGYSVYFYPDTALLHKGQGSSDRTFAIVNIYKNILYFYKKHKPYWQYMLVKLLLITKAKIAVSFGNMNLKNTYRKALSSI